MCALVTGVQTCAHPLFERAIRPITLQRKNALFTGHDLGAENWVTFASLIETCKLSGINPQAYLTDVLARIVLRGDVDQIDRKSVVKGKSVSVRVDLGGRRIIKKKKHNTNKITKHITHILKSTNQTITQIT